MRFLVIGLGSMGKRRIRCLQALGYKEVFGFDLRQDRCEEVQQKYGVKTGTNFEQMFSLANPDRFIISVPPDLHHIYMKKAIEYKKHAFVEASVVDKDYELIKQGARANSVKIIPSATMLFHPGIQMIGNFMKEGKLGKISNVLFHSGQYLPDWHTYEKVSDFYVSNPVTGGAREIVPFELTWVLHYLGFPKRVSGNARKTISIEGAEKIDDTYNFLLDYDNYLATITIDVVSRHSSRRLVINGEKAQLFWDWDRKCIEVYNSETKKWQKHEYQMTSSAQGYNVNLGENMYVEEVKSFIDTTLGKAEFINNLENDHKVLKVLYAVEASDKLKQHVSL